MNILFVGAHHDDLELSCGASVKRWSDAGHQVDCAILTNSSWITPDGTKMGDAEESIREATEASEILGYNLFSLNLSDDFKLCYEDKHVVTLLNLMSTRKTNLLIIPSHTDAHPMHSVTHQIAMAASRKIPRVLAVQISWNASHDLFHPVFFMDISNTLDAKLEALQCYQREWARTGVDWQKFVNSSAQLYGLRSNCSLAEGFEVIKWLNPLD